MCPTFLSNAPATGHRLPPAFLRRRRQDAARAVRRVTAWAGALLACPHLFWIELTLALPIGGLLACCLLESEGAGTRAPGIDERWLRLATVVLVIALHVLVLALLWMEARSADLELDRTPGWSSGIPPPD